MRKYMEDDYEIAAKPESSRLRDVGRDERGVSRDLILQAPPTFWNCPNCGSDPTRWEECAQLHAGSGTEHYYCVRCMSFISATGYSGGCEDLSYG
jgi:predicted RNA-binding Zn-ribbon protein involved in translation (DUF1610 family)